MTTQSIHQKDKAGYVCPSCRMVFSLAQGLGGNGVTCPGCDYLLTIPSRDDGVSVLDVSRAKYSKEGVGESAHEIAKDQKVLEKVEHDEWVDPHANHGGGGLKVMIPIALISLLLIGGLAFFLLSQADDSPQALVDNTKDQVDDSELGEEDEDEKVYTYDAENEQQVAQLEEFLRGAFATKTVDELLPYVRPVEGIREKMVKFYKGEAISQSSFRSLSSARRIPKMPGYLYFQSEAKDYNFYAGVLKYSEDEILLDWESYVGFSEMTWAELAKERPTKPVRVRVRAKQAFYYNEEFADETKWQAVSLINPNEEDAIYGYVLKDSTTEQELFGFGESGSKKVVLDVYYPEDAKKGDQVLIDSVVEKSWVVREEK